MGLKMSLLTVKNLTHSVADKSLYQDASFELNNNDHLGIVGQNGVGKSTLIKLLTGEILSDSGQINWQPKTKYGYLDQYVNLPKELTLYEFLTTAYIDLFQKYKLMEEYYDKYSKKMDENLLVKAGEIHDFLDRNNFYEIDTEIQRVITGLGLSSIGNDHKLARLVVVRDQKLF